MTMSSWIMMKKKSKNRVEWLPKGRDFEGLKKRILCTKRVNYKLILNIAFHLLRARLKQTIVAAVGVTFSIDVYRFS
jgi:hypothetical protein